MQTIDTIIQTNRIGLDQSKANELTEKLNDLLANFQIYYQNIRGFHWNIKGTDFFQLHIKFEELYTEAQNIIDELAERILAIGGVPKHSFSSYLNIAEIKEEKNVSDAKETVKGTLNALSILIKKERAILKIAAEAEDEGTVALISEYIKNQEKETWMLSAWLGK